jgi:hypothetical protein
MHRVTYCLRVIAAAELPTITPIDGTTRPATDAELLNVGLVRLHEDVFECVSQERRDPDTLVWSSHDEPLPGTVIAEGSHRERFARVPAEYAPQVFRAQVIRAADPAVSVVVLAEENVAFVAAQLAETVGDVNGAPLLDLDQPAAVLDEAQRLAEMPGSGVDRQVVPVITVAAGDVVEIAGGIIPHRWHGESLH